MCRIIAADASRSLSMIPRYRDETIVTQIPRMPSADYTNMLIDDALLYTLSYNVLSLFSRREMRIRKSAPKFLVSF